MKKTLKILVLVLVIVMVFGITSTAFAWGDSWSWGDAFPTRSTADVGTFHNSVVLIQRLMNVYHVASISQDGLYGPMTASLVQSYQETHSLYPGGTCNTDTWLSLWSRLTYSQGTVGSVQYYGGYSSAYPYTSGQTCAGWNTSTHRWAVCPNNSTTTYIYD